MNTDTATTKNSNKAIFIFSAVLLFLAIICFIINYSIDHMLSWSLYPAGALIVLWTTLAPLMIIQKHRRWWVLLGLTITVIPFLFLIEYLAPVKGWVVPLALPIAILFLSALAVSLFLFSYFKSNKLYATGITIFLFGVIVDAGVVKIVNSFLDQKNTDDVPRMYTMSASVILTLIFIVAGYLQGSKTNR